MCQCVIAHVGTANIKVSRGFVVLSELGVGPMKTRIRESSAKAGASVDFTVIPVYELGTEVDMDRIVAECLEAARATIV